MSLLNPRLDVVFKLLFTRNELLLHSMLEAVLRENISALQVLNPELPGDLSADKVIVLDVLVKLHDGRRVDVEMQMRVTPELPSRLVFYAAREHTKQLRRGADYHELRPTIVIAWLAEPLFPELDQLHSVFELRELRTAKRFSDDIAIHILQLSELMKEKPDAKGKAATPVRLWARFLSATSDAEFATLRSESATIASAVDALEKISQDPEAQRLAEDRQDSLKLYQISLARSRQQGRQLGRQEGERLLLLRQLEVKFGELTAEQQQRLQSATDERHRLWSERVLTAESLDAVFDE